MTTDLPTDPLHPERLDAFLSQMDGNVTCCSEWHYETVRSLIAAHRAVAPLGNAQGLTELVEAAVRLTNVPMGGLDIGTALARALFGLVMRLQAIRKIPEGGPLVQDVHRYSIPDVKLLEIRDDGTFIPAIAVRLLEHDMGDAGWLLRRAGWASEDKNVLLCHLQRGEGRCDPYEWGGGSRTMSLAHEALRANWDHFPNGSVLDVRVVAGWRPAPVASERQLNESPRAAGTPCPCCSGPHDPDPEGCPEGCCTCTGDHK